MYSLLRDITAQHLHKNNTDKSDKKVTRLFQPIVAVKNVEVFEQTPKNDDV